MGSVEECAVDHSYGKAAVYHHAWDDFAASFISLIANHASQERISEIGDFLFGQSVFSDGAYDLLLSQPSFIIIFWIGVLISVLSVAGAILLLFPCTRNWNTKKVSSKTMAITGTVLAVVSFAFIVTGLVLYSISHFEQGYQRDDQPMEVVKKNIDSFMSTKTQNACFARTAFNPVYAQNVEVPNDVSLNFIEHTGLQQMYEVNYTTLGNNLDDYDEDIVKITEELQYVVTNVITDSEAQDQAQAVLQRFRNISDYLTEGLSEHVRTYGEDICNYRARLDDLLIDTANKTVALPTAETIAGVDSSVDLSIKDSAQAMVDTSSQIIHAASQIGYALDGASEVVSSTWIYYRWFLFAPLILALISSLIAIGFGFYYSCTKSHTPIKGVGCGLMVLGIVVLALTSVVMIPAIVGMTFGYASQASLDPYFYDYNLKGLHISTQLLPNLTITRMELGNYKNKTVVVTSFADVMVTCKKESTPFFNAVVAKDSDVINVTAFERAINVSDLSAHFNFQVDTNLDVMLPQANLDDLAKLQTSVHDALYAIANIPDMPAALEKYHDTIKPILDDIAAWQDSLGDELGQWLKAYDFTFDSNYGEYKFTYLTNLSLVKEIIGNEMNDVLNDLSKGMQTAGKQIHDDLYSHGESCGNLYRSYADAGDLATVSMAGQVQGMWFAAGLVALFFIPLSISLICIGNAYRHGESAFKLTPASVHPVPAKPAVTPPPSAPVTHHVPNAVVAVPPAVPRRVEAPPPAVPIRSTSYQPQPQPLPQRQPQQWQPVYLPPQPVSNFVDPLAYPKATSAHPPPASYAGGPANGYYGQPTSRH